MTMAGAERWRKWKEAHGGDATNAERKRKWRAKHPDEAKEKNREYVKRYRERKKSQQ